MNRSFCLLLISVFLPFAVAFAQNTGIGTTTPGSNLTVNGSIAGGYTAITANTYTLTATDYYIVWNQTTIPGPGVGIFTLPAAATLNKGRIYKIKNNSNLYALALNNTGSVLIDNSSSVTIPPGMGIEIIANGNTAASTTCWEVVGFINSTVTGNGTSSGVTGGGGGNCSPAPVVSGYLVPGETVTTQYVTITVNVVTPGNFTIATNTANGISFSTSGVFTVTGPQQVILYARGVPVTSGSYLYNFSYGNSSCNFIISVTGFNCSGTIITQNPSGTLIQGNAYTGSFTIPYTTGSGQSYGASTQTINGLTLTRVAGTYAQGMNGFVVYNLSGTYTGLYKETFTISECSTATFGDFLRQSLTNGGCASCTAYDAVVSGPGGAWIPITAAEYTAVVTTLSSAGKYMASDALMNSAPTGDWPGGFTHSASGISYTPLPPSSYLVALRLVSGTNPSIGIENALQPKISTGSSSVNGPYISSGSLVPAYSVAPNTNYYWIQKRGGGGFASYNGGSSYYSQYTSKSGTVAGASGTAGNSYSYDTGNVSTANNSGTGEIHMQVISTTVKQW